MVGGKNASLGELINAGISVPPGFAVTTEGYNRFLEEAGIRKKMFSLLAGIDVADTDSLDSNSARVRELIESAPISSEVEENIRESYASLCERCGLEDLPVAVRSSATAEDLPTASFAGQQDTYLWIRKSGEVIKNIRRCWASLFTSRAIAYRIKNEFPHEKVLISVGIQKMVNSKAAGVMFTIDPLNGDPSRVVIEGNWGLGETVVAGHVNPDKFVVDKILLEISERRVSHKHVECIFDHAREEVVEAETPSEISDLPCLENREIMELVKLAKRIEDHYGSPQDIEWAIDKDLTFPDNTFIVQSRPETVWSQRMQRSVIGKKSAHELLMERAMRITRVH
jgi:pyruvate,water dikinase